MEKLPCGHEEKHIIGVEYGWMDPNHYDGISEWRCEFCGRRWGRWTNKELKEGESEPKYGVTVLKRRRKLNENKKA